MGVTGLWTVVAPTARPTQLASLNRKRLAIDASIWIYQFLKAVRDKEGNALRNSHVVGFFRRICKLLYYGIKPVFVFDGGAPILKRETLRNRARRREGRREDAARTAGKLLAVQVARAAEEEEKRRQSARERTPQEEELPPDQELVYVEEIGLTATERQAGRGFKRKDQYHLPDLDVSIETMGAPNDPRIMSQAELEDYARQFHSGEDINVYDFSKIDFESPFFLSLPAGDRYNILNAARLRSRLRMGYSKEQLDGMFPDRMAFSKFQIERVKERNELTQRLMHINGMAEDFLNQGGRIAGEKGKEYILVKNEGVDGGWALGVVSNKKGNHKDNAIDLEEEGHSDEVPEDSEEEEEFEDIAIEGLNRLPKNLQRKRKAVDYDMSFEEAAEEIARKRRAVYEARKDAAASRPAVHHTPKPTAVKPTTVAGESLFVPQEGPGNEEDDNLFEDVLPLPVESEEEADDLQRAIAMSLEHPEHEEPAGGFLSENVPSAPAPNIGGDEDDGFDLQAALAESRRSKHTTKADVRNQSPKQKAVLLAPKFDGPLPFESLNLGQSLLGRKKSRKIEEDLSGGFDRDLGDDMYRKERPPQPMPDWFNAAPTTKDLKPATMVDEADDDRQIYYGREDMDRLDTIRRHDSHEVVDLEAENNEGTSQAPINLDQDVEIDVQDDSQELTQLSQAANTEDLLLTQVEELPNPNHDSEDAERRKRDEEREQRYQLGRDIAAENESQEVSMSEVAEMAKAEPPKPTNIANFVPGAASLSINDEAPETPESEIDEIEWSESEHGDLGSPGSLGTVAVDPLTNPVQLRPEVTQEGDDGDEVFEGLDVQRAPTLRQRDIYMNSESPQADSLDDAGTKFPSAIVEDDQLPGALSAKKGESSVKGDEFEFDYMSESEEELVRQLEIEANEHARFASAINNQKTPANDVRDYEMELKQLRSQQKKDRRDADEVTQVMVQECQALLRHFGLPYITAPMEAEAQCAELVNLGLVDGIVTDDSDIFLFGGTRVYKNMFNAAKFVECYLANELEKEFSLDRRRLIRFAHLLGSDYTEGIPGVGPVTALEILTDFETLTDFKEWCGKVQLGRPKDLEDQLTTPFRRKFRNTVQKRLFLPPGFPDMRVDEAYLNPDVDSNTEPFQWGVPDLDKLRGFLMATVGWNQERTDEVLVPVIRDMNKREAEGTQSNITRFFSGGVGVGGRGIGGRNSGLAIGGESIPAPGGTLQEPTAPRNRTGKESGRMRNAFKRLRGQAERRRKGLDEADDDNEADEVEGLAEPAFVENLLDGDGPHPVETNDERGTAKQRSRPKRNGRATPRTDAWGSNDDDNHDSLADGEHGSFNSDDDNVETEGNDKASAPKLQRKRNSRKASSGRRRKAKP
ncbi:DNA excision repair protein ERCC-5 [Exophiala aquamarina CBS 119918]|uniref:DNA excision repair protein ERCC-5 n=1 Tax=Exophiala aquamarina CBS 119918 TaxID=1182545 RepID=A0A072NYW7_9EURO|nr:DNA excision repair protein ERCC-5 [Exophiala aquamarina CBS 119918]KEF52612.1 DNA excision repair protein ERCC-5 [Exophiala aquamarina CBS 119918]